ncbi:MAG: sodium-dependent transporter [Zoogloeaceae bacterium]|jgi:NSS family neurotransmitter:Na+ symporter|nr:sodium-dependent transporter [Zoogloeaceae bacterium]
MNTSSPERATWTNRWAFILVTIGSSVGLGNIWRFPYIAGTQGGSAFVILYLFFVLLIGIPLLMAETLIGRRGRGNPVISMLKVAEESNRSPWWGLVGWLGTIGALLILGYYSVVSGWIVDYFWKMLIGERFETQAAAEAGFTALQANPGELILCHTLFMLLTIGVVARGVVSGIERANRVMMPALFLILLCLTLWGGIAGDMPQAIHFMFAFKPKAIDQEVVLSALGHAFFSLSLGMGVIIAYGSYFKQGASITHASFWVAMAGILVGLLAGLAIFSLTFAHGLKPGSGPGLILQTLPLTFAHMPGGRVFGLFFFLLVIFAAWTSAISLLEPFTAWLNERAGFTRMYAAFCGGAFSWLLGIGVCFSFNLWSDYRWFGKNLFELLDYWSTCIAMPVSGIAVAIFVGWIIKREVAREEIALPPRMFTVWQAILRYVVPFAILLIFAHNLGLLAYWNTRIVVPITGVAAAIYISQRLKREQETVWQLLLRYLVPLTILLICAYSLLE